MFIQTEATPNPATLKFIPGRTVLDNGTMEFVNKDAAARSPLAGRLFEVPGVTGVFYGSDFVTVTKDDSDWQHLKPAILGVIMEHYMSGAPLLADGDQPEEAHAEEFFSEADTETVATIKDLL
jgi:Scaffold protein Nfu/NifU N terminal